MVFKAISEVYSVLFFGLNMLHFCQKYTFETYWTQELLSLPKVQQGDVSWCMHFLLSFLKIFHFTQTGKKKLNSYQFCTANLMKIKFLIILIRYSDILSIWIAVFSLQSHSWNLQTSRERHFYIYVWLELTRTWMPSNIWYAPSFVIM